MSFENSLHCKSFPDGLWFAMSHHKHWGKVAWICEWLPHTPKECAVPSVSARWQHYTITMTNVTTSKFYDFSMSLTSLTSQVVLMGSLWLTMSIPVFHSWWCHTWILNQAPRAASTRHCTRQGHALRQHSPRYGPDLVVWRVSEYRHRELVT
jgi:hypothetical protein